MTEGPTAGPDAVNVIPGEGYADSVYPALREVKTVSVCWTASHRSPYHDPAWYNESSYSCGTRRYRMKRDSIRAHLRPYSIYGRRVTTINHAFASAIAASDVYDDALIVQALRTLGQDPDQDLQCVYCDRNPAETWDHVFGLVTDKRYSGYGHTVGNLLPCCRSCNSSKGNRHWQDFLRERITDDTLYNAKVEQLQAFFKRYQQSPVDQSTIEKLCPAEMQQLQAVQQRILELMKEADIIAANIRRNIQEHLHQSDTTGKAQIETQCKDAVQQAAVSDAAARRVRSGRS